MDDTATFGRIDEVAQGKSKALLGAQFRALVAAYIFLAAGPYWARSTAHALGIPDNKCSAELSRFAEQNLLAEMNAAASWDRRRLFEKLESADSYWFMAFELVRAASDHVALELGEESADLFGRYLKHVHRDDVRVLGEYSKI